MYEKIYTRKNNSFDSNVADNPKQFGTTNLFNRLR
jgi:hypothetical protein